MNRKIKFRGKLVDDNDWEFGDLRQKEGKLYIFPQGELTFKHFAYEAYPNTVGQYTGLKDKNGVEIYEGDIVVLRNFGTVFVWYNTNRCSFEFREYVSDGGFVDSLKDFNIDLYEVVGNIHDNPELINKEETK